MLPEDGGSVDLWNVGILSQHHMVSQIRCTRLQSSPPWKLQVSYRLVVFEHWVL